MKQKTVEVAGEKIPIPSGWRQVVIGESRIGDRYLCTLDGRFLGVEMFTEGTKAKYFFCLIRRCKKNK